MTSKNGSDELISLLQYMKNTDIDNPDIIVKDKRLIELDAIVTEVKKTEEWEDVKMDLVDIGFSRGMEQGMSQGISQGELKNLIFLISKKKAKNMSVSETADMLETDEDFVQRVYDALEKYNPKRHWRKIISLAKTEN